MACDPRSDTAVHDSHAARVGAGEPRTPTTSRRVEGAPAAPTADGDGPVLLGRAVEAVEELAEFSAGGAARDRGAVAPSGLQALRGREEWTPTGSARDWDRSAGSRILSNYVDYYNETRTHLALAKDAPEPRSAQAPSQGRVVEVA